MTRRRVIGWLIGLGVLVLVLVAADRVSAVVATDTAQHYLAQQAAFEQAPSVRIDGFPFLTQAVEGRYRHVTVRSSAVTLDGVQATDLRADLDGVHLPVSDIFGGTVRSLPVDSVDGSVTFTYAELATLTKIPDLSLVDNAGQLNVSADLAIPGLAITARVTGSGTVRVADGAVRLSVTQLTVAGISAGSSVLSALESTLAVAIPIPALPYGLHITAVTPGPSGVVVGGQAANVVIAPTS